MSAKKALNALGNEAACEKSACKTNAQLNNSTPCGPKMVFLLSSCGIPLSGTNLEHKLEDVSSKTLSRWVEKRLRNDMMLKIDL